MTKRPNYVFDDELYHHGILGQRWGNRRFQNEDGSWTPEGRERYGKGDGERVKIEKAKATYETQKYKANLKSKAQKEKDRRAAAEERNRIKEQAKTNKLIKKEQAKLDQQGAKKFRNTKKMSDEDLASAIDRLKLQAEYNKQYALAKNPDGALAKADRFFEGPTGKAVTQIAVATLPNVANTVVSKVLDSKLKYVNKEDRETAAAANEKARAEAQSFRSKAAYQDAQTKEKLSDISNKNEKSISELKDAELARRETMRKANIENATARAELKSKESERQNKERESKATAYSIRSDAKTRASEQDSKNKVNENKQANEALIKTMAANETAKQNEYNRQRQNSIDTVVGQMAAKGLIKPQAAIQTLQSSQGKTQIEYGRKISDSESNKPVSLITKDDPEFYKILRGLGRI